LDPADEQQMKTIRKIIARLAAVMALAAVAWIGWEFRPWVPAGKTFYVGGAHVDDYEFQVWQRKNPVATEPFTTLLFASKSGHKWMPYQLEFEDLYQRKVEFRKEQGGVAIILGGNKVGVFDESAQRYTRTSNGVSYSSSEIDGNPSGNWSP
jgi:hypothetical protein